jgi:hypothetical protein
VKPAVPGRSGYAHTRLLPDGLAHSGCIAAAFWPPATPVIVGTYPITVSGLSNAKYIISYATGSAWASSASPQELPPRSLVQASPHRLPQA